MADTNPFVYERPLSQDEMVNREQETARIIKLVEGGRMIRLVAPRRYGKTSLLNKVFHIAGTELGIVPVLVDFFGVVSVADVTSRIERAYAKQLKGDVRRRVQDFFTASGLGLSLGALGISVKIERSKGFNPTPALEALLDVPVQVVGKTGCKVLVIFDEFQDILKVGRVDAVMRSRIQHHGRDVSYIFSGSEPGMMRELFQTRARPLYGQAVPERLERLSDGDLYRYIEDGFQQTKREGGSVISALLDVACGHPHRAVMLAHFLWEEVPSGGGSDERAWSSALHKVGNETDREFQELWRSLKANEKRLLKAIVTSNGQPYRTKTLSTLELSKGSARDSALRLIDRGEIEQREVGVHFVDPLFERWVEKTPG